MAGGTWSSQNKKRPGVYIRFKSAVQAGLSVGTRGVVAICEPLSWGPVGAVNTVEVNSDVTGLTGFPMTDASNRFLQEIFRGSNRTAPAKKVLLYRPTASGAAAAAVTTGSLTATAQYVGTKGNSISIVIVANTDSTYTVSTVVDGEVVDSQTGTTVASLTDNAWVKFTGTGNLAATTGAALTGGSNGTVAAAAYTAFLSAIESYKFDILCYDGSDSTTKTAFVNFVKRIADENGQYAQVVMANAGDPDSRFVINVVSGVTLEDGTTLTANQVCWWVAGVEAGANYNESLTYAKYPTAVAVSPALTNSQIIEAIEDGQLVLNSDDGSVKVETDINSLVTYTEDISSIYHKNRVMRLCNTIANDIYAEFSANFIGIVNNNEVGRSRFKSAIVGYMLDIQGNNGIQNFTPDDVTVEQGDAIDAVVIYLGIQPVDAVEKIYLTVEVA